MDNATHFDSCSWVDCANDNSALMAIPLLLKEGLSLDDACNQRSKAYLASGWTLPEVLALYMTEVRGCQAHAFSPLKGYALQTVDVLPLHDRMERMGFWPESHSLDDWYLVNRWDFSNK